MIHLQIKWCKTKAMQRFLNYEELIAERRIGSGSTIQIITSNKPTRAWNQDFDDKLADVCFKQIMTHHELKVDSRAAGLIRSFPQLHACYSIHPSIDLIRISDFNYLAYYNKDVIPVTSSNLELLFVLKAYIQALKITHMCNIIHGSIDGNMLHGFYSVNNFNVPLLKFNGHVKTYKMFQDECQYSESSYLSPLQIILEMMSSKVEPERIEYKSFKSKLANFWHHMCMRTCGYPLPKWTQEYYALVAGAQDYLDFVINRYCLLDGEMIIKDKSKAFGYLHDIDLFGLAMTFHKQYASSGQKLSAEVRRLIGKCVSGDFGNHEPIFPDDVVKPFAGKELDFNVLQTVQKIQVAHPRRIHKRNDSLRPAKSQVDERVDEPPIENTLISIQQPEQDIPSPQDTATSEDTHETPDVATTSQLPQDTTTIPQPIPEDLPLQSAKAPGISTQPVPDLKKATEILQQHYRKKAIDPITPAQPVKVPVRTQAQRVSQTPAPRPNFPVAIGTTLVSFKNEAVLTGEFSETNGIKKIKIQGVERVVRSDGSDGDYCIWKGRKLFLIHSTTK